MKNNSEQIKRFYHEVGGSQAVYLAENEEGTFDLIVYDITSEVKPENQSEYKSKSDAEKAFRKKCNHFERLGFIEI